VLTPRKKAAREASSDRWNGRPVLSTLVSTAVFLVPIGLSVIAAAVVAHALPRPHGTGWWVGWWVIILAVPTGVVFGTDRLARRALPLAVLLKMTMVFPDHAPKRLAVARKAGHTRDLARQVEEAHSHGVADEPVLAAEKILALAAAMNSHDRLTRGHGERVRAFTDLIADELDLPADDRDRLRWSALLHDVGKLAVHPDILNKADKLNDEEWAVIKNHPLEGAKLTAPLAGWLGPWANTIAEHHEKYDGSGYPYGLAAEDISLGGRIVAVADAYDTMTAIRSYKETMAPEAARAELAACADTHFDPLVVRAFLDVSIGKLRAAAGPLAWLGSLPFVANLPRLGQVATTAGRVAATTAAVGGAMAVGTVQVTALAVPLPHSAPVSEPAGGGSSGHRSSTPGFPDRGTPTTTTKPTSTTTTTTASGTGSLVNNNTIGTPSGTTSTTTAPKSTTTTTTPKSTAPSAPTGVAAAAGNSQATVSWAAPSTGGSPISSYTVTPYIGGVAQAPHTFTSSATSEVVTGLANGATYSFSVMATNAVGRSSPSAPSPPVTPFAPPSLAGITLINASHKWTVWCPNTFPNVVCDNGGDAPFGTFSFEVELATGGTPLAPTTTTTSIPIQVTTSVKTTGTNHGQPPSLTSSTSAAIASGSSATTVPFTVGNIGGGDKIWVTCTVTVGTISYTLQMIVW
jgi:hypothetical protein